jgi:hypothetical protein
MKVGVVRFQWQFHEKKGQVNRNGRHQQKAHRYGPQCWCNRLSGLHYYLSNIAVGSKQHILRNLLSLRWEFVTRQ